MLNPLGDGRWHEKSIWPERFYGSDFTAVILWGSLKRKQLQLLPRKQDYHALCLGEGEHPKTKNFFLAVSLIRWYWNQVNEVSFVQSIGHKESVN